MAKKARKKQIVYSIVIPVLNEAESLSELVSQIKRVMDKQRGNYEFIFIDDGSTDATFSTLLKLKKKSKARFRIVKFRKNIGKSGALAVGFDLSLGEIVITIDADLQDVPAEIPTMVAKLHKGYDLVVGWRKDRQDLENKIRVSHIFNSVVSKVYKLPIHDANCGLKVFRKEVVKEIELYGELHRFIPVLAARRGFAVSEMVVSHNPRKYGESKFGNFRMLHAFFDFITTIFLTSFKSSPLQVFGFTGALFILTGLIILIYLSLIHFSGHSIIGRPILFLGILFLLFGIQIFSTGLIGELITSNSPEKTKYAIDEIVE